MSREQVTFVKQAENSQETGITFKCKPTYNFQSIEFEITTADLDELKAQYKAVLEVLMEVVNETGEQKERTKEKVNQDPPTEGQIKLLKGYKIPYNESTTKAQASALIKESIAKASKKVDF